jgi:hypothetical protein
LHGTYNCFPSELSLALLVFMYTFLLFGAPWSQNGAQIV